MKNLNVYKALLSQKQQEEPVTEFEVLEWLLESFIDVEDCVPLPYAWSDQRKTVIKYLNKHGAVLDVDDSVFLCRFSSLRQLF